jgi:hypothetical protein
MNLHRHISRLLSWWHRQHPAKTLHIIPGYAEADRRERLAISRNDCRAIHRAREEKTAALHSDMAGGMR